MEWVSPQAHEIARLKAETQALRAKRYRGMTGLFVAAAGLAADLAGLPAAVSLSVGGLGLGFWLFQKKRASSSNS
jgi:phosphoribosylcarboxyaminoimidazole (NCAIR) mutase